VILGVCLPIPVLAATGLSVPLPATVERIAAALVPWADEGALQDGQSFSLGEDGSILLAPGEASPAASATQETTSAAADPRLERAGGESKQSVKRSHRTASGPSGKPTPANGGGEPSTMSGGGESTTSGGGGGGEDPSSPPTGPVQGAVGTVTEGTAPVVDAVEGAVGGTGVGGVVEDTAGTVDGIVTGIGG
jgi:hypothetical protein